MAFCFVLIHWVFPTKTFISVERWLTLERYPELLYLEISDILGFIISTYLSMSYLLMKCAKISNLERRISKCHLQPLLHQCC